MSEQHSSLHIALHLHGKGLFIARPAQESVVKDDAWERRLFATVKALMRTIARAAANAGWAPRPVREMSEFMLRLLCWSRGARIAILFRGRSLLLVFWPLGTENDRPLHVEMLFWRDSYILLLLLCF